MHLRNEEPVVVTGMGVVSPVGNNIQQHWASLLKGQSGITAHNFAELASCSYRAVGRVAGVDEQLDALLDKKNRSRSDRFVHLGLLAAHEALEGAQLLGDGTAPLRERIGVYAGVGIGGLESIGESYYTLRSEGPRRVSPLAIPRSINNILPSWISIMWGLQGPVAAITNACASGTDAIGLAARMVRHGYADVMIAGGAEACVSPIALASFGSMRALSTWEGDVAAASRPFDTARSGFVLAEGAAMLVLERESHARRRGAKIQGYIAGYGASADAFHTTAMHEDGRGARAAIVAALRDAAVAPDCVGYINAHGTGTAMNDLVESRVIHQIFGARASMTARDRVLVSSSKSMTGHMIGAAGAVEAVTALLALRDGVVPPTINLESSAGVAQLDFVPHHAREHRATYALSNSFGFGGSNAALLLRRFE